MFVQRTNVTQSAAGSLLAALVKGEKADPAFFQQQFTESLDAVTPRRQTPQRHQDRIDNEPPPPRSAPDASRRNESDHEPPAADVSRTPREPAARDTKSTHEPDKVRPSRSDSTTADDRPSDTSTPEAEDATAPAQQPAQPAEPAPASDENTAATDPAAEEANQAAAVLMEALAAQAPAELLATVQPPDQSQPEEAAQEPSPAVDAKTVKVRPHDAGAVKDVAPQAVTQTPPQLAQAPMAEAAGNAIQARRARVNRQDVQSAHLLPTRRSDSQDKTPTPVAVRGEGQHSAARDAGRNLAAEIPAVRAQVATITVTATNSAPQTSDGLSADAGTPKVPALAETARPVTAAAARTTAAPSEVNQSEQVERIARVMRASLGRGGSRVSLQLEPPDLGHLRIQMQIRGGDLFARFEAQTDSARSLLQQNMGQLRDSLASSGIRLVEATVEHHGPGPDSAGGQPSGPGNFLGHSAGGRQETQHSPSFTGSQDIPEAERPTWVDVPAGGEKLNIMA